MGAVIVWTVTGHLQGELLSPSHLFLEPIVVLTAIGDMWKARRESLPVCPLSLLTLLSVWVAELLAVSFLV